MTKKIVVVDDDQSILEVIKIILETEGYEVETHTTGKYIKSLCTDCKDELPSLVILDVLLSGEDGRDLCKLLKTNTVTKQIPVMLFSAHSQGDMVHEYANIKHDCFLPKPFDIEQFTLIVQQLTAGVPA